MYTYEVWLRDQTYHGKLPLTYTSNSKLTIGSVVKVSLKNKQTLGIIRREAPAPKGVAMKPIELVLYDGKYKIANESLKLLFWMTLYYPAPSSSIVQLFLPNLLPKNYINHDFEKESMGGLSAIKQISLPRLTNDQSRALDNINNSKGSFVLHGDTGSGKTRVYIELIKKSIIQNKSCIILVPEIGLVPHIKHELSKVFDDSIIKSLHSGLTQAMRRSIWVEILTSQNPLIIIGPRSALFAPLKNIGAIIVDECHDDGYKQEGSPFYHALRVASKMASLHNATLLLGSATPSINDVYIATEKQVPILRMSNLATKQEKSKTSIELVNKSKKSEFTKSEVLSNTLLLRIKQQLVKKQQSLLFLNRRGSAKIIICTECGWKDLCKNCDLPLTLHEDNFIVLCHICGFKKSVPICCDNCNNPNIIYLGPGTKSIEKEINKLFDGASIARFDGDNNTSQKLANHVNSIKDGSIDIIIGTQVLVKGFDIPKLGLVGVVDADASLSFPDFTTEEKTYQLISQAIGRVGRGHVPGHVVLQSFQPKSSIIEQALQKDWDKFYHSQIYQRKLHNFPPFTFLLKLECSRKRQSSAIKVSTSLSEQLRNRFSPITVLGPSPSFREKQKGEFAWQIIVKSPRRSVLLNIINSLPSGWRYDIDPIHLL